MQVWRETALLERQKWRTPWPPLSPESVLLHGSDKLTSWRRQRRMLTRAKMDQMKEMTETRRVSREEGSWQSLDLHLEKRRQQASF